MSTIDHEKIAEALQFPEGVIDVVLDTDAYNEVDDQFAISWALTSKERMNVQAVYAAPFCSQAIAKLMTPPGQKPIHLTKEMLGSEVNFADTPEEGMELSYQEIKKIFELLGEDSDGRVFRGSPTYITENSGKPVESEAVYDLIKRAKAMPQGKRLYVLAFGAITNVASALMMEPDIADKIVVIWLGGQPPYFMNAAEFNLMQDIPAAQHLLNCGVPLVLIPCQGFASHLTLTLPEVDTLLVGKSKIGSYLGRIVRKAIHPGAPVRAHKGNTCGMDDMSKELGTKFPTTAAAHSRVIWDISTVGYLMNPNWSISSLQPSPVLGDNMDWSTDTSRHPIRLVCFVSRDYIIGDMIAKFEKWDCCED